MKKDRIEIPKSLAARVLFTADRTCCVCRQAGKPVQIHHIDDNPANNSITNLAVLCLDDHRETQIRGGFDRKLDADQVRLYRDDWNRTVSSHRAAMRPLSGADTEGLDELRAATSIAEIYREKQEWLLLTIHYSSIGNSELRDKYAELALRDDPSDENVAFIRGLQEQTNLIPNGVIARLLKKYQDKKDWTQRARLLNSLGRHREALVDYVKGVSKMLDDDNNFSAAFYLKELVDEDLIEHLYLEAYEEAKKRNDLWWQVRALQDLGWDKELDKLLIDHEEEIKDSGNISLKELLAAAKGNFPEANNFREEEARISSAKDIG